MTINPETTRRFETQAKNILTFLKSELRYDRGFMPRPFFVEITGSPSSGKTTTITELDKFLRRMGFRVLRPQEGAEVIRHIDRTTPVYNVRTGLYALSMLLDYSHGNAYDIVIFDRSIYDAYTWMMYWEQKGKLTAEETKCIQDFFLMRLWVPDIDAAYFMVCDPEESMLRELRIALSEKLGETTNPASVKTLVERYRTAYDVLHPSHPNLHLFDTSVMSEQAMVEAVAGLTLDSLERKTEGGP